MKLAHPDPNDDLAMIWTPLQLSQALIRLRSSMAVDADVLVAHL